MHFDVAEVMIAQIAGRKRWRVADNETVESPGWGWAGGTPDAEERRQMNDDFASAALAAATEVEMTPGSIYSCLAVVGTAPWQKKNRYRSPSHLSA